MDLFFSSFGIYKFLTPKNFFGIAPEWLIGLWLIFPPLFGRSLLWMRGKLKVAFIFGMIFSPLSYRFGAKINVIELEGIVGYLIIGGVWGILMSGFVYLRQSLQRKLRHS